MNVIHLYIDEEDVWPLTKLDASFTYKAQNANPGSCRFQIRDEFASLSYEIGARIRLHINGSNVWAGYITSVSYVYPAYVFPTRGEYAETHGVDRFISIEGVDLNYLFTKRFIYNQKNATDPYGPKYDPDTSDKKVIHDLIPEWIDLSGDNINATTRVEAVGTIGLFEKGQPFQAASSWGDVMRTISRIAGAVYYIDADRHLVYTDVDTPSSPIVLSDQPDPSNPYHIGYRDYELMRDASNMVNDYHLWSQTMGIDHTMYSHSKSHDSIKKHGLWQSGDLINSLYHQKYIDLRARTTVYGSPQNKRGAKDDRVSIKLTVFNQPVFAGEKYRVVCKSFAYDDVLPAREVNITFPTPTDVQYSVMLSHEIDDPWSFWETYWPPTEPIGVKVDPPVDANNPEIIRVLDSFTRTQMPEQKYTGPTYNPGWGSGERLQWQTPQHPSNAYWVDGSYGVVGAMSALYQLDDEPTYNEVYAPYPDADADLRNLLIKFRLGRYRRLYQTSEERAYSANGNTFGITYSGNAFDVVDTETHVPNINTYCVIGQGTGFKGFRATPVVPEGGETQYTVIIGSAPYIEALPGAGCYPGGGWGGYIDGLAPTHTNTSISTPALGGGLVSRQLRRHILGPFSFYYGPEIDTSEYVGWFPIGNTDTVIQLKFSPASTTVGLPAYTDAPVSVSVAEATFNGTSIVVTGSRVGGGSIGSLSGGTATITVPAGATGLALILTPGWNPSGGGASTDPNAILKAPNGTYDMGYCGFGGGSITYSSYRPVPGSNTIYWSTNTEGSTDPSEDTNYVFPSPSNAFWDGRNTGAGLVPSYIRAMGVASAKGVVDLELPDSPDFRMRLNSYMFVGTDEPGMTYPWDVNFWVETFGHRLNFSRTKDTLPVNGSFPGTGWVKTVPTGSTKQYTVTIDGSAPGGICMPGITNAANRVVNVPLSGVTTLNLPVFSISGGDLTGPIVSNNPFDGEGHWRWQYRPETQTWRLAFHLGMSPAVGGLYQLGKLSFDNPGPEVMLDVYLGDPWETALWPEVGTTVGKPPAAWPSSQPMEYLQPKVSPLAPSDAEGVTEGYTVKWVPTTGYVDSSPHSVVDLQPDTDYWLRIVQDANGSMHARVWTAGQPEPSAWSFVKRNETAPVGFGGYSSERPTSIGQSGLRIGASVYAFQSYTVEIDLIATGTNAEPNEPNTSVYLCENLYPIWPVNGDRVYDFKTSKAYQAETLNRLDVFGIAQQKGIHYVELDPDQGLVRILAGISVQAMHDSDQMVVYGCYYTAPVESASTPGMGKIVIR